MFAGPSLSPKGSIVAPGPGQAGTKSLRERYLSFCYRALGHRLDQRSEASGQITPLMIRLKQAEVHASQGLHQSVVLLTTLFTLAGATVIALVLFGAVLQPPQWYLYAGLVILIAVSTVRGSFSFLLSARISNRSTQLEREIPFTLSELSVLASTGMSPIDLIHRMAARDRDPAMTSEFKKVAYKTTIQGKDLITSLSETAKDSPSEPLRETFWGLANLIHQGGNLDEYLRQKSEDVLKLKRSSQKAFIERLTTYVDMYISLILIGVLMICVGAFMLNALGSTADGLDANGLLLILTFGIVPASVAVTVVLVMTAYARSE